MDSVLKSGQQLPRLAPMKIAGSTAITRVTSPGPIKKAELHYTTGAGAWQKRDWQTVGATLVKGDISAQLPAERPLVCYLSVTDERDVQVTTAHIELPPSN